MASPSAEPWRECWSVSLPAALGPAGPAGVAIALAVAARNAAGAQTLRPALTCPAGRSEARGRNTGAHAVVAAAAADDRAGAGDHRVRPADLGAECADADRWRHADRGRRWLEQRRALARHRSRRHGGGGRDGAKWRVHPRDVHRTARSCARPFRSAGCGIRAADPAQPAAGGVAAGSRGSAESAGCNTASSRPHHLGDGRLRSRHGSCVRAWAFGQGGDRCSGHAAAHCLLHHGGRQLGRGRPRFRGPRRHPAWRNGGHHR